MTRFKNLSLFLVIVIILTSCNTMSDVGKVMRNEKVKTTDEFLVKKRGPLILPPDFDKIPEPGSINDEKDEDKEKIQKILKVQEDKKGDSKSSSIENEILNKIRK